MFNAEAFKKSVLSEAMQGKLTRQLSTDDNVVDLLQLIEKEKQQLISEGKIKEPKQLATITEDKIPFKVPDNWKWVRLNEVMDVRDGTHNTPRYINKGIPLITSKNIKDGTISFKNVKYISKMDSDKINKRSKVDINDILMPMIGTIGNPAINKNDKIFSIKNVALIKNNKFICTKFIYLYILFIQEKLKSNSSGAVQSFISLTKIRNMLIALPPLAEQKRIVKNINKCFKLANLIDQEQQLTKNFDNDMYKSLLQSAMQGKLTQQLPEDGNAADLLQSITKDKKRLYKAGKIKKPKQLAAITDDEIPFKIPDNWKWVRLANITNIIMGQSPKSKFVYEGNPNSNYFEFHQGKSFFSNKVIKESNKVTNQNSKLVDNNYILMSVRAPVGDVNMTNRSIALGRGLCGISPIGFSKLYLYYYLITQKVPLMRKATGSTFKAINKAVIFNELIPLPPLAEQKRIVNKLDSLLSKINKI